MNDFLGGIDPSARVEVLEKKKTKAKKLGDLKPGDYVGQADSKWCYPVSEVRIFKRKLEGFEIVLESGEKLVVAEDTILCGVFGGNLLTGRKKEVLCFVNMGSFIDADDSRRTFLVEFEAPEKYSKTLKKICRHSAKGWSPDYKKKFYRYFAVLEFLHQLQQRFPAARIVQGLEAGRSYDGKLYDFCRAKNIRKAFMPLFPLRALNSKPGEPLCFPAAIAFCSESDSVVSRKVVSCQRITSNGPWAFPIFDEYHSTTLDSHQRFSFTANGIPVFYPNDFINTWAAKMTLPKRGELQLPTPPQTVNEAERDPVCWDLDSVYTAIVGLVDSSPRGDSPRIESACDSLFTTFCSLAKTGSSKADLVEVLNKKVIAMHRENLKSNKTATP